MNHKNLLKTGKNLLKGGRIFRYNLNILLWGAYIFIGICIVGIIIGIIGGIINMIIHWNDPPPPKLNFRAPGMGSGASSSGYGGWWGLNSNSSPGRWLS